MITEPNTKNLFYYVDTVIKIISKYYYSKSLGLTTQAFYNSNQLCKIYF